MSSNYLTQALHRARRQCPQRTATVFGERRQSYGELCERVARLAGGLQKCGMQPGDRIGILSLNSDRYIELYFAIWWAGGVVNPVNTRWSEREIAFSLDNCDTRILVVDDNFSAMVGDLTDRSESLQTVIYSGEGEVPSGMYGHEQLISENQPVADALRCNDDLAGIFYTGGTTGTPKGVMLSHGNLFGSTVSAAVEGVARAGDIGLHAAPMFHLADGMLILLLTMLGCTQVIVPGFQAELVLRTIEQERVSNVLLVPTMIQMIVDNPAMADYQLSSLTQISYGASAISEALLCRAMESLPNVGFIQAYGQSEMSPLVSVLAPEYHRISDAGNSKLRSAGRPAFGVEVKIVDADGAEVAPGVVGEIAARGPGVMQGYWNKPEQTEAVIRDGWMHTGDGAYMDEDGFIFVVDRIKDMIISGGENIFSAEVENAVAQHPAVATCAVIGIPDEQWGEAVHAVVVLKEGYENVVAEDITSFCREYIAGYKCPRSIEFYEALPLSGAGKILKTILREPYWKNVTRNVS